MMVVPDRVAVGPKFRFSPFETNHTPVPRADAGQHHHAGLRAELAQVAADQKGDLPRPGRWRTQSRRLRRSVSTALPEAPAARQLILRKVRHVNESRERDSHAKKDMRRSR